jgi:hypothetical protein
MQELDRRPSAIFAIALGIALLVLQQPAFAQEMITIVGTLTAGGVECPIMTGDDGETYSLVPREAVGLMPPDGRVRVVGVVQEVSFCQQGTTVEVKRIEPAD